MVRQFVSRQSSVTIDPDVLTVLVDVLILGAECCTRDSHKYAVNTQLKALRAPPGAFLAFRCAFMA